MATHTIKLVSNGSAMLKSTALLDTNYFTPKDVSFQESSIADIFNVAYTFAGVWSILPISVSTDTIIFKDANDNTTATYGSGGTAKTAAELNILFNPVFPKAGATASPTQQLRVIAGLGSTIIAQTLDLDRVTTNQVLTSQQIRSSAIYINYTSVITGVKWYQTTQGVYTGSNYNGVGLYSYSAGTLTLVASSTNDAIIWSTPLAGTFNSKAFSTPYTASPGVYFVAILYSSSAQTTAPVIGASTFLGSANILIADFTNSAKLYWALNSQTSMPATLAMSSTILSGAVLYNALY